MRALPSIFYIAACVCASCSPLGIPSQSSNKNPFQKSNLHVWAYEEYDAVDRTPEERAQVLVNLGITKVGYICRNEKRVSEFESHLKAYSEAGIELVGVWTPIEEVQVRDFLKVVDNHDLSIQWWLTLEQNYDAMPEDGRVKDAVARLRPLVKEANSRNCRLVLYGHGTNRWFTQIENQIEILKQLQSELPSAEVGIIYNFHQSHGQMDRLGEVLPSLAPYLTALNLNGMHSDGPKIARIGKGDKEKEMIETILESGWQGPTGIIAHDRNQDAAITLRENLDGLESILIELGREDLAETY